MTEAHLPPSQHGQDLPTPATGADWVVNRRRRGLGRLQLREHWDSRHLAMIFAKRDLTVRYRQTVLGVAWALLQPMVGAAALVVVFGRLAGVSTGEVPHLPFALVGFAAWTYIAGSTAAASETLIANQNLVTKVYFPRLLLPASTMLPGLVDLGIGLLLGVAVAAMAGILPGWQLLTTPVWILWLIVPSMGLGLMFGALNVRFRDVRFVWPILLQVLFFLTPVAYPADLVSGALRYVYALNPFVGVVSALRWSLFGLGPFQAWWLISFSTGIAVFGAGLLVFSHNERRFADVI
jgi:lipopolysaccharide transport system permease protein